MSHDKKKSKLIFIRVSPILLEKARKEAKIPKKSKPKEKFRYDI